MAETANGIDRAFETDPCAANVVRAGSFGNQAAYEVVSDQISQQLLMDHGRRFASQFFHSHGRFQIAEAQLHIPSASI